MRGHLALRRQAQDFRCLAPDPSVWAKHCHDYFTLSYKRFRFPPDVFPGEFVILSTWADGSQEGRR